MADENNTPGAATPAVDPTDKDAIAKANAEAIAKQGNQDISGHSTKPEGSLDGVSALDALHEQAKEKAKKEAEAAAAEPKVEPKVEDKTATPAAEPKVEDKSAAAPAADKKPDAAPAGPSAEELTKIKDTLFKDAPALSEKASVKAREAFDGIKSRAAQEIATRDNEILTLRAKVGQLEEASKQVKPLTPELQKEIEDLRGFRTKFDIEADPKFKAWDQKVETGREFIYAQLKRSPIITEDVLKQIKDNGGPEFVKMEKILESINDPNITKLVEQTLAQIEQHKFEKGKAIDASKADVKGYLDTRQKEMAQVATAHNENTSKLLASYTENLPWLKTLTPKADAKPEEIKTINQHNEYAKKMQSELSAAANDDSPEMRATLLVGMVQLFRLQEGYEHLKQSSAAKEKDLTTKLEEAAKQIEKLKSSSISRLQQSGAPPVGQIPAPKAKVDVNESAGDALDRIRQEKAKAAANAT